MTPTPCFVCGKKLNAAANDEYFETVPHAGTQFTSVGHYGSTVFDPNIASDGEMLEINICDDCLVERSKKVTHLVGLAIKPSPRFKREVWDP